MNRKMAADRSQQEQRAEVRFYHTKVALRTCLSCNQKFPSEGPWNRICNDCTERNENYTDRVYNSTADGKVEDNGGSFF